MAKERTGIPPDIAAEVMFQHDRTCCVCTTTGDAVQIHHIDENPTNHNPDNLAVLCLEHHHQTQLYGGFARKLGPELVRKHRDDWLPRVKSRRDKADEIAASAMSGKAASVLAPQMEAQWARPHELSYRAFVCHLPDALAAAYMAARPLWDGGGGLAMIDGHNLVTETLERLWLGLSNWFPPGHFGSPPAQYIAEYLAQRRAWHYALARAEADPTAIGSSFALHAAAETQEDAERMIVETVRAVAYALPDFDLDDWERRWEAATKNP